MGHGDKPSARGHTTERPMPAKKHLTQSEHLATIINSAMDAIIAVDDEQRIILFNTAAEHVFGCSAAEAMGKSLDQFIPKQFREAHREHIRRFGMNGATSRSMHSPAILSGIRANGTEFPMEATISHATADGRKLYTVILRDISLRKQTEEALIRSEKLATLGRLAAAVAHEINNPLEAMTNILYLAQQKSPLDDSVRPFLDVLQQQLERAAQITRRTLGFSKSAAVAKTFRPAEDLEGVLTLLEPKMKQKDVICGKEFLTDRELYGIESEVGQVFWNLLNNAVDAVPQGGHIRARVSFSSTHRRGPGIRVSVADDGEGISAEHISHLFEPFFTTKHAGHGLGLWIASEIIKKHGGTIQVKSRRDPNKSGTVFSVFFPNPENLPAIPVA